MHLPHGAFLKSFCPNDIILWCHIKVWHHKTSWHHIIGQGFVSWNVIWHHDMMKYDVILWRHMTSWHHLVTSYDVITSCHSSELTMGSEEISWMDKIIMYADDLDLSPMTLTFKLIRDKVGGNKVTRVVGLILPRKKGPFTSNNNLQTFDILLLIYSTSTLHLFWTSGCRTIRN